LKPALDIALRRHAALTGTETTVTYGSSGALYAQIRGGAPFDILLSADVEIPARLAEEGLAEAPFTYCYGRLVLWVPAASGLAPDRDGLRVLLHPSVKKVALAEPRLAPYGRAAVTAMREAGVYEAMKGRLVSGQSVSQAAQFAASGAVDAAFLPLSLARTAPLDQGRHFPIAGAVGRIEQAGAVLRSARNLDQARAFAAFMAGPEAAALLAQAGYELPGR
jgi:molybdate transport system substrate-binding protein